jgi:YggT family protein
LIATIYLVVNTVFTVYYWLIIARIILSWIPQLASNPSLRPVSVFVFEITEPYLALFRRLIPKPVAGGIGFDFSPLIAIITLVVLQNFVLLILRSLL